MKAIELEKAYNPKSFEDRVYKDWEESGSFKPLSDKNPLEAAGRPNFTVVIPPPNVTGVLHMGHGLNNTLQDIVVRYHRMKGDNTLWLPGTDHAGIATQNVVERRLKKEGLRRQDLGRDKFLEKTWEVKREHHSIISNQQRRLGNSVDWSRERFTLDEGLSKAVREVFVTLYERNLIYRGNYLVNWCPSCGTALADDEVEHEDTAGAMYHMYYEIADGSSIPAVTLEDGTVFPGGNRIEIATTRPETLFGDTAVAVHPDDPRYKALLGKKVRLALTDREIPVVADSYVDRAFGTGVVKITPAHDPNDWEVGKRCGLDILNILNPDGTLNENVPEKYRGLSCKEARKTVVEDLISAGLFKEEEKITHSVGHCYRCHSVVEPYLSTQWFVRMKPMAEKALKAWKEGEIVFYPKKWENTYSHWMENIRDWCISRQLWWGHRIPVWYCQECGKMIVSREDPQNCPDCKAGKDKLQQDPDVLDTWFSSWLWPFSTLGWPEDTADLKTFYPTTALVTAYDIIFFWVSRMIMAGLEFTGKVPFRDINMHGLVRDKQGRKMSKSLGNGLDPLEIIDEYGADALKYTLAFMCAQGQDVLIDKDSFKLGSRFANKIWNASRYILGNLEGRELRAVSRTELKELDLWIIDWYVEATKLSFKNGDEAEKDRAVSVLLNVLEESLRLLHPLLPFVTEEIYRFLPENCVTGGKKKADKLITAPYPLFSEERVDSCSEERFTSLQEIVRLVRALRTECGIDPAFKIKVALFVEKGSPAEAAKEKTDIICLLAGLSGVDFLENPKDKAKGSIGTVGKGFEAFIVPGEGADPEKMVQKFKKELEKEEGNFSKLKGKLSNEKFVANAPAEVVEGEKEKLNEIQRRIEKLKAYVSELV